MRISDWSSDVCSSDLLGVNIDHVATIRNARGGGHPDPVKAARLAAAAGADGITAHLREDRRHISDADIERRSEEHTSELQSLMRISYAVFCLKKKTTQQPKNDDDNVHNQATQKGT